MTRSTLGGYGWQLDLLAIKNPVFLSCILNDMVFLSYVPYKNKKIPEAKTRIGDFLLVKREPLFQQYHAFGLLHAVRF